MTQCLNCDKQCKTKISKYCCQQCQKDFQYKNYIISWLNGEENGFSGNGVSKHIRKWLFDKYNNQCQECGWNKINNITNKIPLEVDHIDGNWMNNKEINLRLLCPNCHSLTSNYKFLNNGNGRKYRIK